MNMMPTFACVDVTTEKKPVRGSYRLTVNGYYNATCSNPPCDAPTESGQNNDYVETGTPKPFFTDLEIPYSDTTFTSVIEIFRSESCDDGTEPQCDIPIPVCDPESEIMAYKNNCYACVNPTTCEAVLP